VRPTGANRQGAFETDMQNLANTTEPRKSSRTHDTRCTCDRCTRIRREVRGEFGRNAGRDSTGGLPIVRREVVRHG